MIDGTTKFGLPHMRVEAIRLLLAGHPRVRRADVYGSRAMGRNRPGSDIDLCLRGEALTQADLLAIGCEIEDLDLPWMVDLSIYSQIDDPALRDHIDRVGQPMYEAAQA